MKPGLWPIRPSWRRTALGDAASIRCNGTRMLRWSFSVPFSSKSSSMIRFMGSLLGWRRALDMWHPAGSQVRDQPGSMPRVDAICVIGAIEPGVTCVVVGLVRVLHGGVCCHRQGYDHVDLVLLLLLGDAPTA